MWFVFAVVVAPNIKAWCELFIGTVVCERTLSYAPLLRHYPSSRIIIIHSKCLPPSNQHNTRLDGHKQETILSSVEHSNTTYMLGLLYALYYSQCSPSDFPSWSGNNMLLLSSIPNKWTAGLLPQWRELLMFFWWSYLGQRRGHICLCQTEDNIWIG